MKDNTMTEEAQRIAIAESVGYRIEGITGGVIVYKPNESQGFGYCVEGRDHPEIVKMLPDYLNDLNAMHEAEKILTNKQREKYIDTLLDADDNRIPYDECWFFLHTTAAQRAEAFLKTINKWNNQNDE